MEFGPTIIGPRDFGPIWFGPTSFGPSTLGQDSIRVQMPDARHIQSTHCGELPLLQSLPNAEARIAHIIQQLTQSLLSISKSRDNYCVATFDQKIATYTMMES